MATPSTLHQDTTVRGRTPPSQGWAAGEALQPETRAGVPAADFDSAEPGGGANMYKPEPVRLTEHERRALRAIEDTFAVDDPELAETLGQPPKRHGNLLWRMSRT